MATPLCDPTALHGIHRSHESVDKSSVRREALRTKILARPVYRCRSGRHKALRAGCAGLVSVEVGLFRSPADVFGEKHSAAKHANVCPCRPQAPQRVGIRVRVVIG